MESNMKIKNFLPLLKKYRYPVLILLIGLILMVIPGKTQRAKTEKTIETDAISEESLEEKLSSALSKVDGAGKVEVILSHAKGEEVIYQSNEDSSVGSTATTAKSSTVTITDSERNQTGLVKQVNPKAYRGAVILCQGADDPTVCLAIVDAVSKATGLGANKICILKMK